MGEAFHEECGAQEIFLAMVVKVCFLARSQKVSLKRIFPIAIHILGMTKQLMHLFSKPL